MFYAIRFGWVGLGDVRFDNIALDIETLNEKALENIYDITAISFGLYPLIKDEYALLRTAVSFGEGYGPKLIKKKGVKLKRNFKVALSGKYTTNALLFRIYYPDARIVYKNFLEIEEAVKSGEVDAGVLIHESILTFDDTLEVEKELWDIWQELSGGDLPLPLGGMAVRRSIPITRAIEYEEVLTKAVEVAHKNRKLLSKMLLQRDLIRVDAEKLDKYLDLYANDQSITMSDKQLDAIDKLFAFFNPPRRKVVTASTKTHVVSHHASSSEFFDQVKKIFTLAECIHESRSPSSKVTEEESHKHRVVHHASKLRGNNADVFRTLRNFNASEFFHSHGIAKVVGQWAEVIETIRVRHRGEIWDILSNLLVVPVQVTKNRFQRHNRFTIENHIHPKHPVGGWVLWSKRNFKQLIFIRARFNGGLRHDIFYLFFIHIYRSVEVT